MAKKFLLGLLIGLLLGGGGGFYFAKSDLMEIEKEEEGGVQESKGEVVEEEPVEVLENEDKVKLLKKEQVKVLKKEDYTITKEEELAYGALLKEVFEGDNLKVAQEDIVVLKEKYPRGFYTLIKIALRAKKELVQFYNFEGFDVRSSRLNLLIHELTHGGSTMCFLKGEGELLDCMMSDEGMSWRTPSLLIGNKGIILNNDYRDIFYTKEKIRFLAEDAGKHISSYDDIYLAKDAGDIHGTLDEMNAYLGSLEIELKLNSRDDLIVTDYLQLLRQNYHLNLYLKYAKESEPKVWEALVNDKAWVILIKKVRDNAESLMSKVDLDKFVESSPPEDMVSINKTKASLLKTNSFYEELVKLAGIEEESQKDWADIKVKGLEVIGIR